MKIHSYSSHTTSLLRLAAIASAGLCLQGQAAILIDFIAPQGGTNPDIGDPRFTTDNPLVAGTPSAFATDNVIAAGATNRDPLDPLDLSPLVGGASLTQSGATTAPSLRTYSNYGMFRWTTVTATQADLPWEFRTLLMVQQSDWNALTSGTVGFESTASMTLELNDDSGGITTTGRFVVNNGGSYYVSQLTTGESQTTLSFSADTYWASFTATDFSTLDFAGLTYSSQTASFFSDIEAVGFYWQASAPDDTGPRLGLEQFTVVTAVPEPTTSALLLGGAGLLVVLLMRRRNRR